MNKVGIISAYAYIEHHANYGSLLQYYALQTYLEKFNLKPYWIRYILPEEHTIKYAIKDIVKLLLSPYDRNRKALIKAQNKFISERIKLSDSVYCGYDEIQKNPPEADIYITGSDQVWGGCIEANYLRFVKNGKPKMAYAASFGRSSLTKEQLVKIPGWIKEIDFVSVRESEGVKICQDLDIPAIMVADPTLLINKEDYPAKDPKERPEFFCYFLNEFSIDKSVDHIIRQSNSVFCGGVNKKTNSYKELEQLLSPEEWIGMIKNTKYVLTNSFHGMIFSIIFQKPFVVFLQNGKTGVQNSRMYSFLSYIGLENRIYQSPEKFEELLHEEIDWKSVSQHIGTLRDTSEEFIKNILKS